MNPKQINHMLEIQDKLNSKIRADWRDDNRPWWRAAYVEAIEAVNHLGWEWWKRSEPNMKQVHLELVDIWHFALSEVLQERCMPSDNIEMVKYDYQNGCNEFHCNKKVDFIVLLENFIKNTMEYKEIDLKLLTYATVTSGLTDDHLYLLYIGKNVLNEFRQENGYKTGQYAKNWNGREDNEVLYDIVSKLLTFYPVAAFEGKVKIRLKAEYDKAKKP